MSINHLLNQYLHLYLYIYPLYFPLYNSLCEPLSLRAFVAFPIIAIKTPGLKKHNAIQ